MTTVSQVFVCRSGSAADTQNISAYVEHFLAQHAVESPTGEVTVATAAALAQQIVYNNKVRPSVLSSSTRHEAVCDLRLLRTSCAIN